MIVGHMTVGHITIGQYDTEDTFVTYDTKSITLMISHIWEAFLI